MKTALNKIAVATAPDLTTLKDLVTQFDRTENQLTDTEALKPKLEAEIAETLDSGDVTNEQFANSLATKRGQLELIPAKILQLENKRNGLVQKIQTEFQARFVDFEHQFADCRQAIHNRLDSSIRPLMADDFMVEHTIASLIVPHTKINRTIVGLLQAIRFPAGLGNLPEAARVLIKRAPEAGKILAHFEPFELETASISNAAARDAHRASFQRASGGSENDPALETAEQSTAEQTA